MRTSCCALLALAFWIAFCPACRPVLAAGTPTLSEEQRDEILEKTEESFDKLTDRIEALQDRTDSVAEDRREAFHARLAEIDALREKAGGLLDQLESATDESWDRLQEALHSAMTETERLCKQTESEFHL